ncbi:MAG: preprotein translocase subunit SecA [Oscillospiraceae bacterium]|jgi:preprotein translocase subunit SecA|nr:preprotein translocase subunit SecA [Oscillospiraceae bacterium]
MGMLAKLFGTHSERELKRIQPIVARIEALEETYRGLSETELRGRTARFKGRLADGEALDDLLPDAFAAVREAADRVLGLRPFRVQLIGGIVLHQGRIAEMKTGEGKTLVATLPAYLNALTGQGVHIVTVNDYLARYHSEWMGKVYRYLGLSVGLIVHDVEPAARRAAYAADITYGTNNEFGFDYLRDNMAIYKEQMVQRAHAFAIVDEVDSILIDEARTPLIISGQGEKSTELYEKADRLAARMRVVKVVELDSKAEHDDIDGDYVVDEKARSVTLTPAGISKAEAYFGIENLSDPENVTLAHHVNQAIRARGLMQKDIDYVVRDGEVIIVDEFTGRLMFGRRYSEGLHQAIEAKEGVKVERESKTLATITFQNYFRMYRKLSGMTGTALTEQEEFSQIYKLDVIEIPTNKPMVREDYPDAVYKNEDGKYRAILRQIQECHERGQPVLVGTVSIEKNELLSAMLRREGIPHVVLNAKHHEKEAEIVAQAGHVGAVTVATNMAGRGTDIMLGGNAEFLAVADLRKAGVPEEIITEATGYAETENEEVLAARAQFAARMAHHREHVAAEAEKVRAAGGLFIIGTERHESRRIDNQLRGRAGRQGDPGSSRFLISMEDDLMRLFGVNRVSGMLESLGMDEDTPIDQKMLSNAIENAQKRVESRNFQTRKHVLEYDDVMNRQREIIYGQRKKVLDGEDLHGSILDMIDDAVGRAVDRAAGGHNFIDPPQIAAATQPFEGLFLAPGQFTFTQEELSQKTTDDIKELLRAQARHVYTEKERALGPVMREVERVVLLQVVDRHWMDHIDAMQELRNGIGLRAYAQTDPLVAYKQEGFEMFDQMIAEIRDDTVRYIYTAQVRGAEAPKREQVARPTRAGLLGGGGDGSDKKRPVRKTAAQKVGRNDPCPCGSGKKYKKCCGFDPGVGGEA